MACRGQRAPKDRRMATPKSCPWNVEQIWGTRFGKNGGFQRYFRQGKSLYVPLSKPTPGGQLVSSGHEGDRVVRTLSHPSSGHYSRNLNFRPR